MNPSAQRVFRTAARVSICLAFFQVSGATIPGIAGDEYRARRAEVRKSLDGVLILFGADDPADLHTALFQEPNFLYLSGWREPGAVMLLTRKEELLFLPPRDQQGETFGGRKTLADDPSAPEKTGFEQVVPRASIESAFLRLLADSANVYTLSGDARAQKLAALAPLHPNLDAQRLLARFRVVKSGAEIALIRQASDITAAGHLAAWKRLQPGLFEYQVAATFTNVVFERGCERSAYAPIVGAGANGVILHYMANRKRIEPGELVLMDMGAECSGYATDVTRTVPAGGKFTPRQREIYEIVLGAQKAAIAAIKPGVAMEGDGRTLQQIAYSYINTHGKDLHGEPLGKYFTHGVGHFVGLDVHDPGDLRQPLSAGMVITIEPGVYIGEENLGVRIEDTLLVTEHGSTNLSAALPREISEIEKLVGK